MHVMIGFWLYHKIAVFILRILIALVYAYKEHTADNEIDHKNNNKI